MSGTLRPMSMTRNAWRIVATSASALVLLSCGSKATPIVTTEPSPTTSHTTHAENDAVTDRARAALTEVGAQQLVMNPRYDKEVNTALQGIWRGYPLTAYVVPTSAVPSASELILLTRREVKGHEVDVVKGQHSTTEMFRFVLGPDTWLLSSGEDETVSLALVEALLEGVESSPSLSTSTATPTTPPDAVAAFIAFAVGEEVEVPWADTIRLSVEGTQVARFDAGLAGTRSTWQVCPSGQDLYEQRDCPVSPLRTLAIAADEGEVVSEVEAPEVIGCNNYSVPENLAETSVWLRPDRGQRNCFSDFAILAALDADGRIAAVDLALSGP